MENKGTKSAPLAVVGTVAIDQVETPFGQRDRVFGGSASYFSYAASFFTPVSLVAVVGEDFPEEYREILKEKSVDLSHLEVIRGGKTFAWKGKYEHDLNTAQTLETHLNVLMDFQPRIQFEEKPGFLFLANIDPVLQLSVLKQMEKPKLKFVACDTMNYWIQNKRQDLIEVLKRVDCFVMNDGEARQLTGEPNLIRAAKKVQEWGPGIVVIKKGEHGVLLQYGQKYFTLPAYPLESVFDPTGAGDSFAGGMMGYLTQSKDSSFETLKKALGYGSIVASYAVEDFGLDRLRKIKRKEIDERFDLFKKLISL
ncbi:MAG: sugar kinase [Candidatus Omnitrophica bacterium]|nr:sugar kinase [Candidatus Omnitrophota bacterium]